MDIQEQKMRLGRTNGRQCGGPVAELADDVQIVLRVAKFMQRTAAGGLIVHDDDVHHVPRSVVVGTLSPTGASRMAGGDSRMAGMLISLIHSPPWAPAIRPA